jgi:hypothetical protein
MPYLMQYVKHLRYIVQRYNVIYNLYIVDSNQILLKYGTTQC